MNNTVETKVKLSSVQKKVFWRFYFFGQAGWNYEKMQGLGYYYSMYPLIDGLYSDIEQKKEISIVQSQFFNTNVNVAPIILGIDTALQTEKKIEAKDTISSIKTGLMGPLAGIGDTLFYVIPSTIIGSIASYMALEGNPTGVILWIVYGFAKLAIIRAFFSMGYKEGTKLVSELGEKLKKITDAANILGMTVLGGLIPAVVQANFALEFKKGDVEISIQELSDQILPGLAPLLVVFLTYWLLGRKNMNSTRVTLLLMVLGILTFNLKIFS